MKLSIKNLSLRYGENIIFQNLSFDLYENEMLGLCGKNGCGKTSLCNAIANIVDDDCIFTGEIMFDDVPIKTMSVAQKCQSIGIIFQEPENQIFSPFVEDELAFAPENLLLTRSEIEDRINLSLNLCDIAYLRNRETSTLSGGEKQLVAIASVLTMQPKILIADEITSKIDKDKKQKIRDMLKYYAKNFGSVIFVTHNDEDKKICDRVLDLNKGAL